MQFNDDDSFNSGDGSVVLNLGNDPQWSFRFTPDGSHEFADVTSGPVVRLEVSYVGDEVNIQLGKLWLGEDDCSRLLLALAGVLALERRQAEQRGFYAWKDAGSPDPKQNGRAVVESEPPSAR